MTGALGIITCLAGVSGGLFALISLLVLVPGRSHAAPGTTDTVIWLGGPGGGEHGVGGFGQAPWGKARALDWTRLAETAEPGRRVGGASAGW